MAAFIHHHVCTLYWLSCHIANDSYDLLKHAPIFVVCSNGGYLLKMKMQWDTFLSQPPGGPPSLQDWARATLWCVGRDSLMEVLIGWTLQAAEMIRWSEVTQWKLQSNRSDVFFLSGRLVNVTWLPDIHPSCWVMSVTGLKRPCVDLWSRPTSSTHLCKCAWLGHCMIMWPCCRFITLSLSSRWGFLSCVEHFLSSFFLQKKTMTRTLRHEMFIAMHIR